MKTSDLLQTYIYPNLNIDILLKEIYIKEKTNSHSLICPSCGKKEAYLIKKNNTIVPFIKCNRLNNCGYNSSLWEYIKNRENLNNKETLYYLGSCADIDIKQFSYSKYTKNKQTTKNFEIKIVHKPYKLYVIDKYYKMSLLIKDFQNLPEKLQFTTIVTFIYRFSLSKDQNIKTDYYKKRGINKTKNIGTINYSDMNELEKLLLNNFDLVLLQKFNLFKDNRFKYYFSSFSVVPSFDIYSNLITAIRLRNINKSKIKEIEISASRIANPLPYGITKEKLLKYDTFYFTEGHIDALSLNLENFVAVEGVNSFNKKNLGYFRNKHIIILFDQDKAGLNGANNLTIFAKKLNIKCTIIKWNKKYGKDINELLTSNNINQLSNVFYGISTQ